VHRRLLARSRAIITLNACKKYGGWGMDCALHLSYGSCEISLFRWKCGLELQYTPKVGSPRSNACPPLSYISRVLLILDLSSLSLIDFQSSRQQFHVCSRQWLKLPSSVPMNSDGKRDSSCYHLCYPFITVVNRAQNLLHLT